MLAICDEFTYKLPVQKNRRLQVHYQMIKQAGFDGVIMRWGESVERDSSAADGVQAARQAGLHIVNAHAPFDDVNEIWRPNPQGLAFTNRILFCVAECARLGIPALVVHLSGGRFPPRFSDIGLQRIEEIVAAAEANGVNIAAENHQNNAHLAEILSRIRSPRLGFCYDSGHQHCFTPKEDLLGSYGDRLMALHLHDNEGSEDLHLLPFDGDINWPKTMQMLKATDFSGALALEAVNLEYDDLPVEEFLHRAYERAVKLEDLFR